MTRTLIKRHGISIIKTQKQTHMKTKNKTENSKFLVATTNYDSEPLQKVLEHTNKKKIAQYEGEKYPCEWAIMLPDLSDDQNSELLEAERSEEGLVWEPEAVGTDKIIVKLAK